jgi:hypothetical protein
VTAELVDSHHHPWDTAALRYSLFETVKEVNRPYRLADFDDEAEPLEIGQSICVKAASAGADGRRETEWLMREIEGSPRVAALVAWAPLEQPDVGRYLDWLTSLRGKPIVGVRRAFEFEPDDFPQQGGGDRGCAAGRLRGGDAAEGASCVAGVLGRKWGEKRPPARPRPIEKPSLRGCRTNPRSSGVCRLGRHGRFGERPVDRAWWLRTSFRAIAIKSCCFLRVCASGCRRIISPGLCSTRSRRSI